MNLQALKILSSTDIQGKKLIWADIVTKIFMEEELKQNIEG